MHGLACYVVLVSSMKISRLSRLCQMISSSLDCPERLRTSSFLTISIHLMPSNFLCHLWFAASKDFIFTITIVIGHISEPYSRVERINDSYNPYLLVTLDQTLFTPDVGQSSKRAVRLAQPDLNLIVTVCRCYIERYIGNRSPQLSQLFLHL